MIGNIAAGLYGVGVTPSTSSYESIATTVVGSGGTSSITFTESGSAWSSYKHLQLRGIVKTTSNQNVAMRFNGDNSGLYNSHVLYGNGSSAGAGATGTSDTSMPFVSNYWGTSSTYFSAFVTDILDFKTANKNRVIRSLGGTNTNGGNEDIDLISGLYRSTNAITSITILGTGGTSIAEYSHFALYGIKD
jgi:hypothetical protein